MTEAITTINPQGQTVSEVPGQPGRVITSPIQHWSSDSGTPDPITRKPDLFPNFPSDDEDDF
jgi:hypothetical protein